MAVHARMRRWDARDGLWREPARTGNADRARGGLVGEVDHDLARGAIDAVDGVAERSYGGGERVRIQTRHYGIFGVCGGNLNVWREQGVFVAVGGCSVGVAYAQRRAQGGEGYSTARRTLPPPVHPACRLAPDKDEDSQALIIVQSRQSRPRPPSPKEYRV